MIVLPMIGDHQQEQLQCTRHIQAQDYRIHQRQEMAIILSQEMFMTVVDHHLTFNCKWNMLICNQGLFKNKNYVI